MVNEVLNKLGVYDLWSKGIDGRGTNVAVIDTGINNIANKITVVGGYNCTTKTSENYAKDNNGHGTKVASIICGTDIGVAPKCNLYSIKANLSSISDETLNEVIDGIKWCINNNIDVINMSLGFESFQSNEMKKICNEAYEKGIVIICGAGNNNISQGVGIPALYKTTISISNINKNKIRSASSSFSKSIDFCCYGEDVLAYDKDGSIISVSGTSFAAPYVTGIIALMKQQNSTLTPLEIYQLLKDNCEDLGDKGKDIYYGYGLVKAINIPDNYLKEDELIKMECEKNIYFPQVRLTIEVNQKVDSNIKFLPEDIKDTVEYKVGDTSIAIVDTEGFVSAKKPGTTNLVAIYNNKAAVCEIKVIESTESKEDNTEDIGNTLFNFNDLNVYEMHRNGIKGKGVKIGLIGYGCIDSPLVNVTKYVNLSSVESGDTNTFGTIFTSLISSPVVGIAPECEMYVIQVADKGGAITWANAKKAVQWCINNKMDIIYFNSVKVDEQKALLESCYNNNIICVVNGWASTVTEAIKSKYSITVSYVTNEKKYISNDKQKSALSGTFIDCCSFGYGMQCINANGEIQTYSVSEAPVAQYYCNIAVMEVIGVLALIKQQDPTINNAVKVRALLPELCETLYGAKNNNTGYGLLKAKLLSK